MAALVAAHSTALEAQRRAAAREKDQALVLQAQQLRERHVAEATALRAALEQKKQAAEAEQLHSKLLLDNAETEASLIMQYGISGRGGPPG